jgi:hypothetical protein
MRRRTSLILFCIEFSRPSFLDTGLNLERTAGSAPTWPTRVGKANCYG